jgi:hypothetical protein
VLVIGADVWGRDTAHRPQHAVQGLHGA